MTIVNIVDHRTNKYDTEIDLVIEPAFHDNSIKGATQFKKSKSKGFNVDGINKTTVEDAIDFANQKYKNKEVTLYLYDLGSNPIGPIDIKDWDDLS